MTSQYLVWHDCDTQKKEKYSDRFDKKLPDAKTWAAVLFPGNVRLLTAWTAISEMLICCK